MAQFARGARGRGGTSFRGRGGNSARGRAISRGKRSTFHSTRVEEPQQEDSDQSEASDVGTPEAVEGDSDTESSESDPEDSSTTTKPYNALLQALNSESAMVQPPRKKRKVALDDASAHQPIEPAIDEDIDHVEEPEEGGNLPADEIDDAESLDDVVNGMFAVTAVEPMD